MAGIDDIDLFEVLQKIRDPEQFKRNREFEEFQRNRQSYRSDGTKKSQKGFLGPLINLPSGKVMTELSIGVEFGGQEVEIPSMVPTLDKDERLALMNLRIGIDKVPESIVRKAADHAIERMKRGLSPFYVDGEEMGPQEMNLGGSVSTMMGRTPEPKLPELTPAQIANLTASLAPGAATADIFGEFPEFPSRGLSTKEMLSGPRSPSLAKNLAEGAYFSGIMQLLGGLGDAASAIPLAGPVVGGALKLPRALQRLQKAKEAGFDTETVYYHATDRFEGDVPDQEFTTIVPSEKGKLGPGIYLSPKVQYSERYINEKSLKDPRFGRGARVLPVFVRGKIGTREDFGEAIEAVRKDAPDKLGSEAIKRQAQQKMADDGFAGFKVQDELVIFDPKNIRSVNAEFEDLDSPDLLKAEGGEVRKFAKGGILDLIVKDDFDPRFDPRVKEQDMLRNLEAEIIGSNYTQPMPRLALSDLEGEDFVTSMADRTRAGGDVKSINRVELVDPIHLPGGQDFMFNNPSAVWASAEKPSREILELAREFKTDSGRDPLYIPWRMAPTGGDFSTTTGELMLGYAASNMTKTTKKALDKAIRSYRTKGVMVKGNRVGAGKKIEGWKGIDDPSSVEVWRNTPDAVRKELMNMMDVQFRDKGGLSIGAARLMNADPKQLTARDAGIQNVGRIFADIDIFDSAHPSYPFAVPGGGVGVLENASAATVFDLLPKAKLGDAQKPVKDPANPTAQEIRALQMKPYGGTITEDILRRMEARGVDVNSIVGLTGGALTFTLLSAGLVTPQEVQAGALKEFAESMRKADEVTDINESREQSLKQAREQGFDLDNVMYHASKQDIDEFVPGYDDGLVFLTPSKEFANNWLGKGKFKERQGGTGAIEGVRAEIKKFNKEADEILKSLPEDQASRYYEEVLRPKRQQLYREEREADSAIYPVVTRTKKPFVPSEDFGVLEELFGEERFNAPFGSGFPTYKDALKDGNYLLYETKEVVDFLKSKGYDSMFLKESSGADEPFTTLAVFDPSDIRSVNAKFDPKKKGSPKILASVPFGVGLGAMGTMQDARAATLQAQAAPFQVALDAATAIGAPIVGGLAGLAEFRLGLPSRLVGDLTDEEAAERIRAVREGVSSALNYDPTSEIGREMSQKAQEGIAQLAGPVVKKVEPAVTGIVEQITDPQNVTPLGLLYQGGKYLYEDVFGEPEREAAKSAMDVAL